MPQAPPEGVPLALQGEALRVDWIWLDCVDAIGFDAILMVLFRFWVVGLQEPPPQIVARPLPNDILEWRKYLFLFRLLQH